MKQKFHEKYNCWKPAAREES